MHEALITNWNKVVKPKDKVYMTGDFSMSREAVYEFAPQLNGTKHLILGNHDQKDMQVYKPYFKNVFGCSSYKGCIITHIPVHTDQLNRFKLNIHSHLHENNIDDPRYFNVSCEQLNYTPIHWDEIKIVVDKLP